MCFALAFMARPLGIDPEETLITTCWSRPTRRTSRRRCSGCKRRAVLSLCASVSSVVDKGVSCIRSLVSGVDSGRGGAGDQDYFHFFGFILLTVGRRVW
jgi:hypothetical protein